MGEAVAFSIVMVIGGVCMLIYSLRVLRSTDKLYEISRDQIQFMLPWGKHDLETLVRYNRYLTMLAIAFSIGFIILGLVGFIFVVI